MGFYGTGDQLPRRKYGRLRKKVTYEKPEDCRVCKKGIYCPIHPNNKLECKHHKLKLIVEREKRLKEELEKQNSEKEEKEKKEKKSKELKKAKELWD